MSGKVGRPLEERLWAKVAKGDECWEWSGGKNDKGYGLIGLRKKLYYVHRLSYEWHLGPIPDGMLVLHSCDNPACVNPSHLSLGTVQDNSNDMVERRRHRTHSMTHCKRGHLWEQSNIIVARSGTRTWQRCKACHKQQCRNTYIKRINRMKNG